MRSVLALLALVVAAGPASANVVYTYTGNPFTEIVDAPVPAGTFTTADSLSFTFETAEPLPPNLVISDSTFVLILSFSYSAGANSARFSGFNDGLASFGIATDENGAIVAWSFSVLSGALQLLGDQRFDAASRGGFPPPFTAFDFASLRECNTDDVFGNCTGESRDDAENQANPGTWTMSVVPEPTPVPALGGAAAALLGGVLLALGVRPLAGRDRRVS